MFDRLLAMRDRARARKGDEGGFTLIELIVVIIIFSIMIIIATSAYSSFRKQALAKKGDAAPAEKPKPEPVEPSAPPVDVAWGTIFGVLGVILVGAVFFAFMGVFIARVRAARRELATARTSLEQNWEQAVARHMGIKDAYGNLLLDPVAALTHSALWDVTNTRTQAFHEIYTKVQDIHSLHTRGCPEDAAVVAEYAEAVRKAETLWADAVAHSERLGYDWMPAADKTSARRAVKLLQTAQNPAASDAERGMAASKAKDLIDSIGAVTLKTETLVAIDDVVRLALTSGQTEQEPSLV